MGSTFRRKLLNQAISLAGGTKLLKGELNSYGSPEKEPLKEEYSPTSQGAEADAPNNPVLANGDLIRVNDSILSGGVEVLNELTSPFVGLYSVYSLLKGFSQ